MVPCIILELEEEKEEMAPNLRVGFKERQCKRLSDSLPTAFLPAERTCPEVPPEMPVSNIPLTLTPLSDVVGSYQALVVRSFAEKDACSVQEMTSIGQTQSDDLVDKGPNQLSHS